MLRDAARIGEPAQRSHDARTAPVPPGGRSRTRFELQRFRAFGRGPRRQSGAAAAACFQQLRVMTGSVEVTGRYRNSPGLRKSQSNLIDVAGQCLPLFGELRNPKST